MRLVEMIRGRGHLRDNACRLGVVRGAGKNADRSGDYPGFIANRILMPMINEAIYAVMEGVGRPRRSMP